MADELNIYGWVFLVSLAVLMIGILGWYVNRSMVELAARLDRSGEEPKYSYLQAWLLPKYRAGMRRWANQDFHENVDAKSKNLISRIALSLIFVGLLNQTGHWTYVYKFAAEGFSFLGPVS